MSRHLPVILASKLDEFIERRNERIRRDGIILYVFGVASLFYGIWGPAQENDLRTGLVLAFIYFLMGTWRMLAYKRSLSSDSEPVMLASGPKTMYCPTCAQLNSIDVRFCYKCGQNLKVVSQAMTRHLPSVITNRLDRYIEKNRTIRRGTGTKSAVGATVLLALGLYELITGGAIVGEPGFLILLACSMFVVSVWEGILERREFGSISYSAEVRPELLTDTLNLQSSPPPSVSESTTELLDQGTDKNEEQTTGQKR